MAEEQWSWKGCADVLVPLSGPRLMLGSPQLFYGSDDLLGPTCPLAPPAVAPSAAAFLLWRGPRMHTGCILPRGKDVEVLHLCRKW